MPTPCSTGCGAGAVLKRPKTGHALCRPCFFRAFEQEVHHTIMSAQLFNRGDYVAIAASGGKDSTVLAHVLSVLNRRHDYGLRLTLLSIDEGISGYRDDSLQTVRRNSEQYQLPLTVLSYERLYGWSMDRIVREVGRRNNCTFCGVFRRQALDRGAALLGVDHVVTGHNADDIAETVLMNVLRGDVARLKRCVDISTSSASAVPRSKPFKYTYEKEIVMYAHFKKLDYFSTECIYSPNAYRGYARAFLKDLERIRPSAILDIIYSGEGLQLDSKVNERLPQRSVCSQCGHVSSQSVCKACVLLRGLNQGKPRLAVGKSSHRLWTEQTASSNGLCVEESGASDSDSVSNVSCESHSCSAGVSSDTIRCCSGNGCRSVGLGKGCQVAQSEEYCRSGESSAGCQSVKCDEEFQADQSNGDRLSTPIRQCYLSTQCDRGPQPTESNEVSESIRSKMCQLPQEDEGSPLS